MNYLSWSLIVTCLCPVAYAENLVHLAERLGASTLVSLVRQADLTSTLAGPGIVHWLMAK